MGSLGDCLGLDAVPYLDRVDSVWQDHCSQMLLTRQIFLYLDRTHVLQLSSSATPVKSIFDMGLALFRTHLAERPQVGGGGSGGGRGRWRLGDWQGLVGELRAARWGLSSRRGLRPTATQVQVAGARAAQVVDCAAVYGRERWCCWWPCQHAVRPPAAQIKERTVEGLLELVQRERCGEGVNRALLQRLLRMLSSLGIYTDAFHEPFMKVWLG